jgi:hypothetical protein
MRALLALTIGVFYLTSPASAQSPPPTLADLRTLPPCELDRLFEQASVGSIPVGRVHGEVLLFTDSKRPRSSAKLANSFWKGKDFEDDGAYINLFLKRLRALRGQAEFGESWHDGKPAILLGYPKGTLLFGNVRDEMREVAPGLYLGRVYDRCPAPRFRGYFALQVCCLAP